MKPLHVALAVASLCLPALAQKKTPLSKKSQAEAKARIAKKVKAMREAMRKGKVREYNVFVKVRLKNGNRLRGVVKQGKFVELHDGIDFVSAARADNKRSGMRVWYTVGTTSYVFLRYADIAHYEIGSRLTNKQVKSIEMKLEKQLETTRRNYRRLRDASKKAQLAKAESQGSGTGTGAEDKEKDKDRPKLSKAQSQLLLDFPPQSGWGEQKMASLKQRRITLGVFPNEKEQRFEKSYTDWLAAFKIYKKRIEYDEKKATAKGKTQGKDGLGGLTPPKAEAPPVGAKPPKGR